MSKKLLIVGDILVGIVVVSEAIAFFNHCRS